MCAYAQDLTPGMTIRETMMSHDSDNNVAEKQAWL
jgi:hypothetical protein